MNLSESSASVPSFDPCCPLTCSTCSLALWTPGCHFIPLCSHVAAEWGRPGSRRPPFQLLSLPPAIWQLGDPSSRWPTLVAASRAGIGPVTLHVEMERVPVVFDAIYNPGRRGGVGGGEVGVSVTVELFQLSLKLADDAETRHESCCWQRPAWVGHGEKNPGWKGRIPEISEPAFTHIWGLQDDLGTHHEYRWLGQGDRVLR